MEHLRKHLLQNIVGTERPPRWSPVYWASPLTLILLELMILLVKVAEASCLTFVHHAHIVLCKYVPHDGVLESTIRVGPRNLLVQFSGSGKWCPDEMASWIWGKTRGIDRFSAGYYLGLTKNPRLKIGERSFGIEGTVSLVKSDQELIEQLESHETTDLKPIMYGGYVTPIMGGIVYHGAITDKGKQEERSFECQVEDQRERFLVEPLIEEPEEPETKKERKLANKRKKLLKRGIKIATVEHNDPKPEEGEAYGFKWIKTIGGVILTCRTMLAAHLLGQVDETKHCFPDMQSEVVPPRVRIGDRLEVWHQGCLQKVLVDRWIMSSSKMGSRTVWGLLPAFKFKGKLTSGSPIFNDGRLQSVITKSDGKGLYAVSGIGRISGHVKGHRVRFRRVPDNNSVYGNLIGDFAKIKAEAMREKNLEGGPLNTEVYILSDRIDVTQWRGDNKELLHTRDFVDCQVEMTGD